MEKGVSDVAASETPPEETPDEGMGTARDEWDTRPESDPKLDDDFGMSAGYPIITDDAVPQDPGNPLNEIETPPKEAMQGAPIFSEGASELTSPVSKTKRKPPSQNDAFPADQGSDEFGK